VPRNESVPLPFSVEEGIRMVISGGILLPEIPELHSPRRAAEEAEPAEPPVPASRR
jgi:uncharacterized membrane protein